MKNLFLPITFIFLSFTSYGQFAPDFTVTDTDGNQHNLYTDYLDLGKTVVIKLFFVGCPPCTNIAPNVEQLYQDWGAGQEDVQFFEFSTKSSDSDGNINNYLGGLNVTIPASGMGGGYAASEPYRMGEFGTFWGTPGFAVIAPDRNVVYFKSTSNIGAINDAIESTGATGGQLMSSEPSNYEFNFMDAFGNELSNINIEIVDLDNSNSTSYPLSMQGTTGLSINDFEDEYPGLSEPAFRFTVDGQAKDGLSALDLITLQKHILGLELIASSDLIDAGDANGNGSLSAADMITIQKLILGIFDEFPNGLDPWLIDNNDIPVQFMEGETFEINVNFIKRGNVKN